MHLPLLLKPKDSFQFSFSVFIVISILFDFGFFLLVFEKDIAILVL